MAIELIKNEIRRFIASREPEVLCINGQWGTGKTFTWRSLVNEALGNTERIGLPRYCYVSLFGLASVDALKQAIFESQVDTHQTESKLAKLKVLGRKSSKFVSHVPALSEYVSNLSSFGPLWFALVKDTVICVDDVERRGQNLSVKEVLGLISHLRENRGCKVALILNDEALENDKEEFERYFEKVVDIRLSFERSVEECASIALNAKKQSSELLAENCAVLGISNIRVVRKIERALGLLEPLLTPFHNHVLREVARSVTILGWSLYEPARAPSIDFLRNRSFVASLKKTEELPENHAAWHALLDTYGWHRADEFDLVLIDGLRRGYFDPESVTQHSRVLHNSVSANASDVSFNKAWDIYHDSFDSNEEDVSRTLYDSFIENARHISPMNLNGTVGLFKDLGQVDKAAELIAHYVRTHEDRPSVFNLDEYPFASRINDPDVISAFQKKHAAIPDDRDPVALLFRITKTHSWNQEDLPFLAALPVEEFRTIFKRYRGDDLRQLLNACLQFDRIVNASAEMKEISSRAKAALVQIGGESRINALRVKKYGLEVPNSMNGETESNTGR